MTDLDTAHKLRTQRAKWREAQKGRGLAPIWTVQKLSAYIPIPDHAFVTEENYTPRTYEALVHTQHSPHTAIEPANLRLINEVANTEIKEAKRKKLQPDSSWLETPWTSPLATRRLTHHKEPPPATTPKPPNYGKPLYQDHKHYKLYGEYERYCRNCHICVDLPSQHVCL